VIRYLNKFYSNYSFGYRDPHPCSDTEAPRYPKTYLAALTNSRVRDPAEAPQQG